METIRAGHYRVGRLENVPINEPKRTIGVIRGDVANQKNDNGFENFLDFSKTRWYVYERIEYVVKHKGIPEDPELPVVSIEFECNTRKEAVRKARKTYAL